MLKFLETCKEPVTRKQIAKGLNEENVIKISHILAVLLKYKEVSFIEHPADKVEEIAGYKTGRRTRFFFIIKNQS